LQTGVAVLGELETDESSIFGVRDPAHQAEVLCPVDQLDGAVVSQLEILGHVRDGGSGGIIVALDRQEQLVLSRGEPCLLGPIGAPLQEAANSGSELEESAVVLGSD